MLIFYSEGTSNAHTAARSHAASSVLSQLAVSHRTLPGYTVNCLNLTLLPPQFYRFKQIGTEAKILSSGRHNRAPHTRLVVILDAGRMNRYKILKLCMNVSIVNYVNF